MNITALTQIAAMLQRAVEIFKVVNPPMEFVTEVHEVACYLRNGQIREATYSYMSNSQRDHVLLAADKLNSDADISAYWLSLAIVLDHGHQKGSYLITFRDPKSGEWQIEESGGLTSYDGVEFYIVFDAAKLFDIDWQRATGRAPRRRFDAPEAVVS